MNVAAIGTGRGVAAQLQDVILEYALGRESLRAVDVPAWWLGAGEHVALFGPSGCGKSSFLHLLAGLLLPQQGTVRVCGEDLHLLDEPARDRFRARHVGYVFQGFHLLQGYTAMENVLLGATFSTCQAREQEARELLALLGVESRARHLPSQLSSGEQQRVAIARALLKSPRLLLADEPTAALDPRRTGEAIALLRDACRARNCALVVVSHEPEVVQEFERRDDFLSLNRAFGGEEAQ